MVTNVKRIVMQSLQTNLARLCHELCRAVRLPVVVLHYSGNFTEGYYGLLSLSSLTFIFKIYLHLLRHVDSRLQVAHGEQKADV